MTKAKAVPQPCAATPKGGVPAGCAALVEAAAGMMLYGERDIGRKMLEELLRTASRSGCADRPHCGAMIARVAELLEQDAEEAAPKARRA